MNADESRENIYEGKQSNNLYFVDLEFVNPPGKGPTVDRVDPLQQGG